MPTLASLADPLLADGPLHDIALHHLGVRRQIPVALRIAGLRGLEGGVSMVSATARAENGRMRSGSFVVKRLDPEHREAAVYRWLAATGLSDLGPRVLRAIVLDGRPHLVLERVRPVTRWPWREAHHTGAVVDALASLHTKGNVDAFARDVPARRYRDEVLAGADGTLAALETALRCGFAEPRAIRSVARIAERLDDIDREISAWFPPAVLHGDVHPGNAILAAFRGDRVPKLVDWQRARIGSPLEDLCSWLQSVGCWEPAIRQRQNALVTRYLQARGREERAGRDLRNACWLAGARNAFAGALRYHLAMVSDPSAPARARAQSRRASDDWLRIIRRASLALN